MQVTLLASLVPSQAPVCAKYPDMPGSGVTGPAHLEFLSTVGLERGPFEVQGPRELGVPSSTQHLPPFLCPVRSYVRAYRQKSVFAERTHRSQLLPHLGSHFNPLATLWGKYAKSHI